MTAAENRTKVITLQQWNGRDVFLHLFAQESHYLAQEHINAYDVMTFCLYIIKKCGEIS